MNRLNNCWQIYAHSNRRSEWHVGCVVHLRGAKHACEAMKCRPEDSSDRYVMK